MSEFLAIMFTISTPNLTKTRFIYYKLLTKCEDLLCCVIQHTDIQFFNINFSLPVKR